MSEVPVIFFGLICITVAVALVASIIYSHNISRTMKDMNHEQKMLENEEDESRYYNIKQLRSRLSEYISWTDDEKVRYLFNQAKNQLDLIESLGHKLYDIERIQTPEMVDVFSRLKNLYSMVKDDVQQNTRDILAISVANTYVDNSKIELDVHSRKAIEEEIEDGFEKMRLLQKIIIESMKQIAKINNKSGSELEAWIVAFNKLDNKPTTEDAG